VVLFWLFMAAVGGGGAASGQPLDGTGDFVARSVAPSVVVMAFPPAAGSPQRPPVEFDHAAHTGALEGQGCETCHPVHNGRLAPALAAVREIDDREALINAYHGACIGCHTSRAEQDLKAGPVTCGECHVRRRPSVSQRVEVRFDGSLHGRHAQAFPDKCDPCHHVYDDTLDKLVYVKGAEDACAACHGEARVEDAPSLRSAAHTGCVGCHHEREGQRLESGPVLCAGCHAAERVREIRKLDPVPRLLRGQADTMWVHTEGTTARLVPFDHLAHERDVSSCSDCHHAGIKKCGECHTLAGGPEGDGVVLQRAHHERTSARSCVGCHAREARAEPCGGCHGALAAPAGEAGCVRCHSGPAVSGELSDLTPPSVVEAGLAALPPASDDFPESLDITVLVDRYEAAKLPHRRIAERLDRQARESGLAAHFHGDADRLCAGCHHHAPVGARPPTCRSCHGSAARAGRDMPGLAVAYHRRCIGCHQRMRIEKQGCTDCHAEREERT
jgi:hypothetical protein